MSFESVAVPRSQLGLLSEPFFLHFFPFICIYLHFFV